jgi:hypothetical protein
MPMQIFTTTALDSIHTLAEAWKIADWDVILSGDGSGSGWDLGCGWGCVLIDRESRGRQEFHGGMNFGTVDIAELMPYVQAMAWYAERRRRAIRLGRHVPDVVRVRIVTDHKSLADDGNAIARGTKSLWDCANSAFWAALLSFERAGFAFGYRWIPRASAALNCYVDEVSKAAYRAMKTLKLPEAPNGRPVSPHDCNADDDLPTILHDFARKQPPRKHGRERGPGRDCGPADDG